MVKAMFKNKTVLLITLLVILNIIIFFLSISFGSVNIPLKEVFLGLFNKSKDSGTNTIINSIRLPRVLASFLSGMALACSGLILQTITRNDLCAPNIIGINSGAGFFVILALCIFPMAYYLLPLFAFLGATLASFIVITLASTSKRNSPANLILGGVAVSALFNAGISFFSSKYPDILSSYTSFSIGGFSNIYIENIIVPGIIIILGIISTIIISPRLNILCLGDQMASSLGIRVKALRIISIIIASSLCAASVSYAGLIGFIGLIVPHISRKLVGNNIKELTIVTLLIGSSLLTISDLLGRVIFAPSEISCGIIISLIGAPFFLFLLLKRREIND